MGVLPKRAKLYVPDDTSTIKGCIQIVHGMAEHQMRYVHVAEFFKENGFVVVTSDLRGHGDNVESKDDLGHFGGVEELIDDVKELFDFLKADFPGKPCILIGHSMGTLVSTSFFKVFGDEIDGLILSGMPGNNPATGAGKALVRAMGIARGWHHRSKTIAGILNGPFAKAFPNEDDPFVWLSVDKENIAKYHEDEKCGYMFTVKGYDTLLSLMQATYGKMPWNGTKKDIPIRLISGAQDPCRVDDKTFMQSVQNFKDAGYTNVTYKLIPDQRHEIFNDTKRWETLKELLDYINDTIIK